MPVNGDSITFYDMSAKYIVGCRGVVQLGGPDPWYYQGGPAKVEASKSIFYITLLHCSTQLQSVTINFQRGIVGCCYYSPKSSCPCACIFSICVKLFKAMLA